MDSYRHRFRTTRGGVFLQQIVAMAYRLLVACWLDDKIRRPLLRRSISQAAQKNRYDPRQTPRVDIPCQSAVNQISGNGGPLPSPLIPGSWHHIGSNVLGFVSCQVSSILLSSSHRLILSTGSGIIKLVPKQKCITVAHIHVTVFAHAVSVLTSVMSEEVGGGASTTRSILTLGGCWFMQAL